VRGYDYGGMGGRAIWPGIPGVTERIAPELLEAEFLA
jgi:hypothetical protein